MRGIGLLLALVPGFAAAAWSGEPISDAVGQPPKLRPGVPALVAPSPLSRPLLKEARSGSGGLVLTLDHEAVAELKAVRGPVRIDSLPLGRDRHVDLELERFRVTLPSTQFVVGGDNLPFAFDPEAIVLLRGRTADDLNSHVYLAISEHATTGMIESDQGRFGVSSRSPSGGELAPGEVAIFQAPAAGPNA